MLSILASNPDCASKVSELLQGKTLQSIGWSTLFDCLSIYKEKFKQSLQSPGALSPEFQEGYAKALVAYLTVLQKVVRLGTQFKRIGFRISSHYSNFLVMKMCLLISRIL